MSRAGVEVNLMRLIFKTQLRWVQTVLEGSPMPQSQQEHSPTSALTELSLYLQSWLLLVLLLLHTQTENTSGLQKPQSCSCLPCPQEIL